MPRLDATDWRILYALDCDATQSLAHIGKKLRLGRDVIHYRVKRLEREGVIQNYVTIIDYGKLGYLTGALYIKFQHDTPSIQQEVIEHFKNNPWIWWIVSRDGAYDFAFAFWARDVMDLKEQEIGLLKKYRSYFNDIKIRIYHSLVHFPRTYLVGGERNRASGISIPAQVQKITDETDEKILGFIAERGRASFVETANALHLSAAQVHYRLVQLRKQKVILGSRALINRSKLGYSWYKLDIYLDDYSAIDQMKRFISIHPNAVYLYDTLGGADVDAEFEVRDESHILQIENALKQKFPRAIRYIDRYRFTTEHKLAYFPRITQNAQPQR